MIYNNLERRIESIDARIERVSARLRRYSLAGSGPAGNGTAGEMADASRDATSGKMDDTPSHVPADEINDNPSNGTSPAPTLSAAPTSIPPSVPSEAPTQASRAETSPTQTHAGTGSLFDELLKQVIQGRHVEPGVGLDGLHPDQLPHSSSDIVVEFLPDGRIAEVNHAFVRAFGYRPLEVVGTVFVELVELDYREAIQKRIMGFSGHHQDLRVLTPDDLVLFRAQRADGTFLSMEGVLMPYSEPSRPSRVRPLLVMRDLSTHASVLEELRRSKDNYDALSETITETIVRVDEDLTIVFANSAMRTTFGYEPYEVMGKHFSLLFPPAVFQRHEADLRKYFVVDDQDRSRIGLKNTLELLGRHKNRGISPMELSIGNSKEYKGRTLTCIIRDITDRKNVERRLRHLAYHDKVTGLGNRDLFALDIRTLLKGPTRDGTRLAAVMFLDLDGFKQVNDTLGHEAGDELLVETGQRLRKTLRQSDGVYRFGGDEFVVLLASIHQPRDAGHVANKLLAAIRKPFPLNAGGNESSSVTVGASIGIALIPSHGTSVESLTRAADLAMYSAKSAGKNRYAYYNSRIDVQAAEQWEIEQGIKTALERHEFELYYQPLVDGDGYIRGLEALLRWQHPTRGTIAPARFIPVAEQTGLIVPLGNWVLEAACRDITAWNRDGYPDIYVSVNLSARQFEQRNLVETLGRIFERTGVNQANVKLEITESSIMSAPKQSIRKMHELKEHYPGLTLAIDDFGTGYSSLSYLSQLPADVIKIDLSFVTRLFSMSNQKIVQAIIHLAHALGLEIVAEGVENEDQWQYFKEQACRTLQGYHFKAPVARNAISSLLKRGRLATPASDSETSPDIASP